MILKILKVIIRTIKNSFYFFISWEKIDNETLRKIIRFFEFLNLIPSIRSNKEDTIVSLTTYGERFSEVHYTLFSLFKQNAKPDKIVLWLDEDEFTLEQVSNDKYLSKYIKKGLEVRFCKNFKSYKKIIPSLKLYPKSTIIICDDDAFYNKHWLSLLLKEQKNYQNQILCHIGTKIKIEEGRLYPYSEWQSHKYAMECLNLVPIGIGGTLVKKDFFYKDICDDSIFMNLLPNTDDLWIWAQSVLNNTSIRIIKNSRYYPKDFGTDRKYPKLWEINNQGGNDLSMKNLINHYPQLKKILNIY